MTLLHHCMTVRLLKEAVILTLVGGSNCIYMAHNERSLRIEIKYLTIVRAILFDVTCAKSMRIYQWYF